MPRTKFRVGKGKKRRRNVLQPSLTARPIVGVCAVERGVFIERNSEANKEASGT